MNVERAQRILRDAKRVESSLTIDDYKFFMRQLEICLIDDPSYVCPFCRLPYDRGILCPRCGSKVLSKVSG